MTATRTVGEAIRAATELLGARTDSARLDAELLMAEALKVSRSDLFLRHMREPEPPGFAELVARRAAHEPVAYIRGYQEFFGLPFMVSPAVLIPRGDSETLVEAALAARDAELQAVGLSPASLKQASDFTSAALRTPQAGHVIETAVTVGQRIEAGVPLFRLADTRQLQLDLQLSVDKARQIRNGDIITIAQRQASAVVVGVSRATDANQVVRARARVTQPGLLSVGEVVQVQIQSPLQTTRGWNIPIQALVQHPTAPMVFVATDQGFRPTPVRVLSSDDDHAVVEGALQGPARVAISGVASLRALQQQER